MSGAAFPAEVAAHLVAMTVACTVVTAALVRQWWALAGERRVRP